MPRVEWNVPGGRTRSVLALLFLPLLAAACEVPATTPPLSEAELWVETPRVVRGLQQGLAAQDLLLDQLLRREEAGWTGGGLPLRWPELIVDHTGRILCDRGTAALIVDERAGGDVWTRRVSLRAEGCEQTVSSEWPRDPWDEASPVVRHSETVRIDGAYAATATWPTEFAEGPPSDLAVSADFTQEYARVQREDDEVLEARTDRVAVNGLRVRTAGDWPNAAVVWNGEVVFESLDEATELYRAEWRFEDWSRAYDGDETGERPTHVALRGRFAATGGPDGDHGCLDADLDVETSAPFDAVGLLDRRYCFREGALDAGAVDLTFTDGDKVIGHSGERAVDLDCQTVHESWLEACFSPIW